MSISAQRPNLMVGVPSGYLGSQIPFPPNVGYNVSVGVEIAPGIGIGLDGRTLLVGPGGHQGRTDFVGHLKDGTIPQRDTVVLRSGDETVVDSVYDWQDYQLKGNADRFTASNIEPNSAFSVSPTEDGFRVENPRTARAWTVKANETGFSVASDFAKGETFQVSKEGNVTTVDSNVADQDFTITQQANGAAVIDGRYSVDDFSWKPTEKGYDLQGHYEQQHFAVIFS